MWPNAVGEGAPVVNSVQVSRYLAQAMVILAWATNGDRYGPLV
jgi:hypothetical protein